MFQLQITLRKCGALLYQVSKRIIKANQTPWSRCNEDGSKKEGEYLPSISCLSLFLSHNCIRMATRSWLVNKHRVLKGIIKQQKEAIIHQYKEAIIHLCASLPLIISQLQVRIVISSFLRFHNVCHTKSPRNIIIKTLAIIGRKLTYEREY